MFLFLTKFVRAEMHLLGKDFQISTIFNFIPQRDKRRIIKACSISHFDTILQRQGCPVGWGCRIHLLLLCKRLRSPQRVSWI